MQNVYTNTFDLKKLFDFVEGSASRRDYPSCETVQGFCGENFHNTLQPRPLPPNLIAAGGYYNARAQNKKTARFFSQKREVAADAGQA
jgi:hypothetical protein